MYRLQQNVIRHKLGLLIFNEVLTWIKKIEFHFYSGLLFFYYKCHHMHLLWLQIFKPLNLTFLKGLKIYSFSPCKLWAMPLYKHICQNLHLFEHPFFEKQVNTLPEKLQGSHILSLISSEPPHRKGFSPCYWISREITLRNTNLFFRFDMAEINHALLFHAKGF